MLRDGRIGIESGDLRRALDPLNRARLSPGDPSVRRLAFLWQARCEGALPDSFLWDWAVLPSDDLGVPEGLEDLPVGIAWLLREEMQAGGIASVAPFERVLAAIERIAPASPVPIRSEASRHSIQTTEGIKARLAILAGPTGRPLYSGPLDGSADPKLGEAVRSFQSMLGLEATGVIDAATIRLLGERVEARLLEPPPDVDPSTVTALASGIPARRLLRSSLRMREGIFFFEALVQDAGGATLHGPVSAGGPLEDAPAIARSALKSLLGLDADGESILPALRDLAEAGRVDLLLARGERGLARQRLDALAGRNPGWERIAVLRDVQSASDETIAAWESAWEARLRLLGSFKADEILERAASAVSDLPRRGAGIEEGRRGPVRMLTDEGRIRVEGDLP